MYYFIVNPSSNNEKGCRTWKKVRKALEASGTDYQARLTSRQGDARAFARELTEGCKEPHIIVVVGGDGTMNEVLDGLSFCGPITLGYIPAGTGNDLARSLKLPQSPSRCLKKILYPQYHKMLDYGVLSYGDEEVAHRRFMVSAGIGMDAAVCHNLLYSKSRKALSRLHLGKVSYILIGLKQLMLAKSSKGYLLLDGVKKVEFNHIYFISIHIHPYEGGGFQFAPKADCGDGRLSVCVMNSSSKRNLVPMILYSLRRKQPRHRKGSRFYDCREVVIHTDRPLAVHVDGESCFCQKDLEISCVEKKIRMII